MASRDLRVSSHSLEIEVGDITDPTKYQSQLEYVDNAQAGK